MNLKHLSNSDLHQHTKQKAEGERHATIELLWHLREVERRMLFAQMSYRDLKEYCVKELKLSESGAWRRINAMRLLKEIPEVESKIQSGDLNLTQVTMARAHFREVKATIQEKKEILLTLENQSTRVTERILAEKKPEGFLPAPIEAEKALRGQKLEVTFVLDEELQKDLSEIELLMKKRYSKLELFKMMTKQTLDGLRKKALPKTSMNKSINSSDTFEIESKSISKTDPTEFHNKKYGKREAQPAPVPRQNTSRYISVGVRRFVAARDQNRCQYVDPISTRQCEARSRLQFEHKYPFAKGGTSSASNLQLLCPNHNVLRAVQVFGSKSMQNYIPTIR